MKTNIIKNNKKHGFTLVEFIVVIAIIAILSAVLIPTFVNLIRSARISADTQIARNMNTALAAAEILDGKNETLYDAVRDIQEVGYTVDKLTPSANGCSLVWDRKMIE